MRRGFGQPNWLSEKSVVSLRNFWKRRAEECLHLVLKVVCS
jgi:hypothetical protein